MDWYDQIEEPIRGIVKALRDNGINTTCSCGHEMTIQADIVADGQLFDIHNTLFCYLAKDNPQFDYTIVIRYEIRRGLPWRCWADIKIGENNESNK